MLWQSATEWNKWLTANWICMSTTFVGISRTAWGKFTSQPRVHSSKGSTSTTASIFLTAGWCWMSIIKASSKCHLASVSNSHPWGIPIKWIETSTFGPARTNLILISHSFWVPLRALTRWRLTGCDGVSRMIKFVSWIVSSATRGLWQT